MQISPVVTVGDDPRREVVKTEMSGDDATSATNSRHLVATLEVVRRTGAVTDPELLARALVCVFVEGLLAERRGESEQARELLDLQADALASLPELRRLNTDMDQAAVACLGYHLAKQRRDAAHRFPPAMEPRRPFVVPREGVPFICDVCGKTDRITKAAPIVVPVDYGPIGAQVPEVLRRLVSGGPDRVYRLVVTCRRHRDHRFKRCHDEQFDGIGRRWIRCAGLISGRPDFCDDHRAGEAERERKAYDWKSRPDAGRRRCRDHATTEHYLPR
jgi:hypothetical protein